MWSTLGFVLPSIGPMEMIIILAIVLLIFGPGKLPGVGRALGRSITEFKSATSGAPQKDEPEVKKSEDPMTDKA